MKLIDMIVCEDIRPEADGRISVTGIYDDINVEAVLVPKDKDSHPNVDDHMAVPMELAILFRFQIESAEDKNFTKHSCEITLDDHMVRTVSGAMKLRDESKYLRIHHRRFSYPLDRDGKLAFKVTLTKDDGSSQDFIPLNCPEVTRRIEVRDTAPTEDDFGQK